MFDYASVALSIVFSLAGVAIAVLLIMQPEMLYRSWTRVVLIGLLLVWSMFIYWLGSEHELLLRQHEQTQKEISRYQDSTSKLRTDVQTATNKIVDVTGVGVVP